MIGIYEPNIAELLARQWNESEEPHRLVHYNGEGLQRLNSIHLVRLDGFDEWFAKIMAATDGFTTKLMWPNARTFDALCAEIWRLWRNYSERLLAIGATYRWHGWPRALVVNGMLCIAFPYE